MRCKSTHNTHTISCTDQNAIFFTFKFLRNWLWVEQTKKNTSLIPSSSLSSYFLECRAGAVVPADNPRSPAYSNGMPAILSSSCVVVETLAMTRKINDFYSSTHHDTQESVVLGNTCKIVNKTIMSHANSLNSLRTMKSAQRTF
jgi:hypothetical protein